MPTIGIVLRQNRPEFAIVNAYYAASGFEPTKRGRLGVDRTEIFDNTFLGLCERIEANRRSHVVVVAHGSPTDGFIMDLAPSTNVSAGYCMPRLNGLVDTLGTLRGNEAALTDAMLQPAKNDFHMNSVAELRRLVGICYRIRSAPDVCFALHVRGCNIGQTPDQLRQLRRLFGATVVSAPTCGMFFAPVGPNEVDPQRYARQHRPQGRRRIWEAPGAGALLLDIRFENHRVRSHAALAVRADLLAYAKLFYDTNTPAAQQPPIPVAGLYPDGTPTYVLAHETDAYAGLLAAVRD